MYPPIGKLFKLETTSSISTFNKQPSSSKKVKASLFPF